MKRVCFILAMMFVLLLGCSKDDSKEKEAKVFADSCFSLEKYNAWINAYKPVYFFNNRLDSLPAIYDKYVIIYPEGSDKFYEMIKDSQFTIGWDDARSDETGACYRIGDPVKYGDHVYESTDQEKYKKMW